MVSTTGTSIESYLGWVRGEVEKKFYGEVSIKFKVCQGKVTDVRRESVETDHIPLRKEQ